MAGEETESPFDVLVAEMRETLAAIGTPKVRLCALVVEVGSEKVIVCSSDPRQWVAQALLSEAVDQIKHARKT